MRGFDAPAIGIALLLVPLLAWLFGRSAGRRDMGVGGVIIVALLAGVIGQALAMAASSGIEVISGAKTAFPAAVVRRLGDLANLPEFLGFLAAFATFVGMIGWSSVPAVRPVTAPPVR